MLKLNGKLFRFTREGIYIYDIQNNFFKKADPNPLTDMRLKFIFGKNFCQLKKLTHLNGKFSFNTQWKQYFQENTEKQRPATG